MIMGASNLMMGLTLVLVICLAVVLGLVLVLLAELYCSILIRRRQFQQTTTTTTTNANPTAEQLTTHDNNPPPPIAPPSLSNFYSHGVLDAPRNLLYPSVAGDDLEKQQLPPENHEDGSLRKVCSLSSRKEVDLVYISNPMYDDENGRRSKAGNTPFETPDTSPSRLETEESSGDDEREEEEEITTSLKVVVTPPITPMKKLPTPAEVRSATSMQDGGGDSIGASSSSSSGTPCTSLSW